MTDDRDNVPEEALRPDRPGDSFLALLIKDVIAAEARLAEDDDQGNRRNYVRTAFAAIEGSVWLCREHVRGVAQTMRELTPLADLALRERSYSVTEQGELIEQVRFVTLPAMIRLIVKQAKLVSPGLSVDFGGTGWSKLKQAIDIRNRATHPKSIEDLHISHDDLQAIRSGFYWTLTTNADVMAAVNATFSTYTDNMRVLLEALKAEDPRALKAYRWSLLHMEDEP